MYLCAFLIYQNMKKVLAILMLAMVVTISANSCKIGFSKGTYISTLESFVTSVEQDYQDYDETDWQRADERMTAFNENYEKYADKFTSDERRKVSKLMTKYEVVRGKAKVSGFFNGINDIIDQGMGTVEGVLEGLTGSSSEEKEK